MEKKITNNDFLRRIRYALDIKDNDMIKIFSNGELKLNQGELRNLLKKPEDEGFVICNNQTLNSFLDGLIISKRGKKEDSDSPKTEVKITKNNINNIILRKLRVAFSFKSDDMIKVFNLGNQEISSSELSALFRREDHKNYRECGDKYIRVFLKGLTALYHENN